MLKYVSGTFVGNVIVGGCVAYGTYTFRWKALERVPVVDVAITLADASVVSAVVTIPTRPEADTLETSVVQWMDASTPAATVWGSRRGVFSSMSNVQAGDELVATVKVLLHAVTRHDGSGRVLVPTKVVASPCTGPVDVVLGLTMDAVRDDDITLPRLVCDPPCDEFKVSSPSSSSSSSASAHFRGVVQPVVDVSYHFSPDRALKVVHSWHRGTSTLAVLCLPSTDPGLSPRPIHTPTLPFAKPRPGSQLSAYFLVGGSVSSVVDSALQRALGRLEEAVVQVKQVSSVAMLVEALHSATYSALRRAREERSVVFVILPGPLTREGEDSHVEEDLVRHVREAHLASGIRVHVFGSGGDIRLAQASGGEFTQCLDEVELVAQHIAAATTVITRVQVTVLTRHESRESHGSHGSQGPLDPHDSPGAFVVCLETLVVGEPTPVYFIGCRADVVCISGCMAGDCVQWTLKIGPNPTPTSSTFPPVPIQLFPHMVLPHMVFRDAMARRLASPSMTTAQKLDLGVKARVADNKHTVLVLAPSRTWFVGAKKVKHLPSTRMWKPQGLAVVSPAVPAAVSIPWHLSDLLRRKGSALVKPSLAGMKAAVAGAVGAVGDVMGALLKRSPTLSPAPTPAATAYSLDSIPEFALSATPVEVQGPPQLLSTAFSRTLAAVDLVEPPGTVPLVPSLQPLPVVEEPAPAPAPQSQTQTQTQTQPPPPPTPPAMKRRPIELLLALSRQHPDGSWHALDNLPSQMAVPTDSDPMTATCCVLGKLQSEYLEYADYWKPAAVKAAQFLDSHKNG
jgi:hypothetical protein